MGVVWAARDELLHRDVAVKEVTAPPGLDDEQRAQLRDRTMREARAAARIGSSAAVTVYDVVEEDGRPWIVMELLPGRSLADVLREEGPLPPRAAARLGLRLLEALTAAHAAGVLHRDVKPANVLYDASGQAVLTDFGIASLEGDPSTTTTGTIVGSPGYVAPERAHGHPPTAASDMWSLGVTLAAAVHGRSPFERDTALATMVSALQEPLPEQFGSGPLGVVIDRLLQKDPAERADAAEARRLLEAFPATGAAAGAVTAPQPPVTPGEAERTQALPLPPAAAVAAAPAAAVGHPAGTVVPPPPPRPVGPRARPAPAAATTAPARKRSVAVPAVLAAVVALVVAGVVLAFVLDRRDPADTAAAPGVTATPEPTAGAQATAAPVEPTNPEPAEPEEPEPTKPEPSQPEPEEPEPPQDEPSQDDAPNGAEPGAAPDGFQLYEDPAYRVAVPEDWAVEVETDSRTRFVDPESRRYLLVEEGGEPAGDPVEDWQSQEPSVAGRLDGYELIDIERADFRNFETADWRFTWEPSGGTLQVLNRAVVDDDQAFALYWSVPVEEVQDSEAVFEQIAASFLPVD